MSSFDFLLISEYNGMHFNTKDKQSSPQALMAWRPRYGLKKLTSATMPLNHR